MPPVMFFDVGTFFDVRITKKSGSMCDSNERSLIHQNLVPVHIRGLPVCIRGGRQKRFAYGDSPYA
jgi:hypothetical protein